MLMSFSFFFISYLYNYRESSINSPRGVIYFKPISGGGGLIESGAYLWEGVSILDKTMISVLHK